MAKKRAIIGFKGIALSEVTENTMLSYVSNVAKELPFAGTMNRTAKEQTQDINYDDELYATVRDVTGEDVEIRIGEVTLEKLAELGLGTFDAMTQVFEGDFNVVGKTYALRCVNDTVDHLPYYFNWRIFDLNGIRFDNFQTKGGGIQVCEVIINGTFGRPRLATLKPYAITRLADDRNNEAACQAFLANGETYPKSGAKSINSFVFEELEPAVACVIGPNTIEVTVPFGTVVTALTPTIVHSGASISPASGAAQNFTSPVVYTVTAQDGTTKAYTVTVTVDEA
jgi:hypothetical protein